MPSHQNVPLNDSQKAQWINAISKMDDTFLPALAHQDKDTQNKRVYVIAFDGTWNDRENIKEMERLNERPTNPAQLEKLLSEQYDGHFLDGKYYEGVGTRDNEVSRLVSGATGHGTEERAERAFKDFQEKATQWLKEDPNAQIHVFVTGFSRGSASARHFLNLLDERGVPADKGHLRYADNPYSDTAPSKQERVYSEYLRAPGSITSSALLYDTVATGQENVVKLGIPPSTYFVVHITSQDENRSTFPLTSISGQKPQGPIEEARYKTISLPGVHSDIGGGYPEGVGKLGKYLGEQTLYKLGFDIELGSPPYEALTEGMHAHKTGPAPVAEQAGNLRETPENDRRTWNVENAPMNEAEKLLLEQDLRANVIEGALRYMQALDAGKAPPDPDGRQNFAILLEPHGDGTMTVHVSDPNVVKFDEHAGTISVYGEVVKTLSDSDYDKLEKGEPYAAAYSAMPDYAKDGTEVSTIPSMSEHRVTAIEHAKPAPQQQEAPAAAEAPSMSM